MECLTIVLILVAIYLLLGQKEGTVAMPPAGVRRIPGLKASTGPENPIRAADKAVENADDRVKNLLTNSGKGQWWNW